MKRKMWEKILRYFAVGGVFVIIILASAGVIVFLIAFSGLGLASLPLVACFICIFAFFLQEKGIKAILELL